MGSPARCLVESVRSLEYCLITSDQIIITNEGRTRVSLWGSKVGKSGIVMEKGPRTLTPGVPYLITGH